MPDNTWSCTEKFYDPLGSVVFESFLYRYGERMDGDSISFPVSASGSTYLIIPPKKTGAAKYYGTWSTPFSDGTFETPFPAINSTTGNLDPFYRTRWVLKPDAGKTKTEYDNPTPTTTRTRVTITGIKTGESSTGPVFSDATTAYTKDLFGRLKLVVAPMGADITDYGYNAIDQMVSATLTGQTARTFTYDALGNPLTSLTPERGLITYNAYDSLGNLLKYTDARGSIIQHGYDPKGRMLVVAKDSSSNILRQWIYDQYGDDNHGKSNGKIVKASTRRESNPLYDWDWEESYVYGGLNGRLSHKESRILSEVFPVDYVYDDFGQLISEDIPDAEISGLIKFPIVTAYRHGRLFSRTYSDGKGLEETSFNPSGAVSFTTFRAGEIGTTGAFNHVYTTYAEDELMARLKGVSVKVNSETACWKTGEYSYDYAGNIAKIGTVGSANDQGGASYSYDKLMRLVAAKVDHFDPQANLIRTYGFGYVYDDWGNLTKRTVANNWLNTLPDNLQSWLGDAEALDYYKKVAFSTTWNTPNNNRIAAITPDDPNITTEPALSLQYDANGNVTKDGTYTMTYDSLNQLLSSSKGVLADQTTEKYIYDVNGERVMSIKYHGLNQIPIYGNSTYFIRSGGQLLAEFNNFHNGTITDSRRYKSYLYAGSAVAATAEREVTYSTMFEDGHSGICPQTLAEKGGLSELPSLSDPIITPHNGQLFSAEFSMQGVSEDFVGAMVRIARIKDQGNDNNQDTGNGKRRADEDRVEVFYFLQPGMDADYVFRKYGLAANENYGTITTLISGVDVPLFFNNLQTDKRYRVTLTIWTSIGADPIIGYNLVDLEEGELTVPKDKPNYYFHSKNLDKNGSGGGFEGIIRASWADMADTGTVSYDVVSEGSDGTEIRLNDSPITDLIFEQPLSLLKVKGYSKGAALSVKGYDASGASTYYMGPLGAGTSTVSCDDKYLHPIIVPPVPSNLKSFLTSMNGQSGVALFWEGVSVVDDGHTKIPVGYEVYVKVTDGKNTTITMLAEGLREFYFLDGNPPQKPTFGQVTYQVCAVTMDFYHTRSAFADIVTDTSLPSISPVSGLSAKSMTGVSGQRKASVFWTGAVLAGTLQYDIYRAVVDTQAITCQDIPMASYSKVGFTTGLTFTDDMIPGTYANPLVSYKVVVADATYGPVTYFSECAATHCALCTNPPAPPQGLYGYSASENITLAWSAPQETGTYEYWVYRGDLRFDVGVLLGKTSSTAFNTSFGTAGQAFFSVITSDLLTGCRSTAEVVEISISGNCTTPPIAPANAKIVESGDIMSFTWDASSGAVGYNVYRKTGTYAPGDPLEYVASVDQTGYAEYVDSGVTVTYAVAAVNNIGCESGKSTYTATNQASNADSGPTYYFYTCDHLGSVRLIFDAQADIISRLDYEPFGVVLPRTTPAGIEPPANRMQYTGQERDSFTSYDNMHFRYYASSMGRFMKPDNMITNAANPQSWNLYSYVNGNPVSANDPTGHGPSGRSYPAYMQGSHSFGMTWYDQFRDVENYKVKGKPVARLPWFGQAADNSWYSHFSGVGLSPLGGKGLIDPIGHFFSMFAEKAYHPTDSNFKIPSGWSLLYFGHLDNGLDASMFFNSSTHEVILAFAGVNELIDVEQSIEQMLSGKSSQFRDAYAWIEEAKCLSGGNVTLVGHSLGGGLSAAGAIIYNLKAVTFNAEGVNASTVSGKAALARGATLVTNYYTNSDWLTWGQRLTPLPNAVGVQIGIGSGNHGISYFTGASVIIIP